MTQTIGIIGSGAWGTALAMTAAKAGNDVLMWAREADVVDGINAKHANAYLPAARIPEAVRATTDIGAVIAAADIALLVAPAQFTRPVLESAKNLWRADLPLVLCAKGIELNSGLLLSEVARQVLPKAKIAVLSGPGFAEEVAREKPTAVTIAASKRALADDICRAMQAPYFRPYASTDIITPQVCGAIKNVLAIAAGLSDSRGFGDNGRAALITRGLVEMARFSVALGGRAGSVLGLSGVGDLILTANSRQSRNYSCGASLGQNKDIKDVLGCAACKTVEGIPTATAVLKRAATLGVEMPICEAVHDILTEKKSVDAAMQDLFTRPLKAEE